MLPPMICPRYRVQLRGKCVPQLDFVIHAGQHIVGVPHHHGAGVNHPGRVHNAHQVVQVQALQPGIGGIFRRARQVRKAHGHLRAGLIDPVVQLRLGRVP